MKKIVQNTFGGFSCSYYRPFHNNNILHTLLFFLNKNFLLSNQWLKYKMYQVKKYTCTSRRNNIMHNTTDQDEKSEANPSASEKPYQIIYM